MEHGKHYSAQEVANIVHWHHVENISEKKIARAVHRKAIGVRILLTRVDTKTGVYTKSRGQTMTFGNMTPVPFAEYTSKEHEQTKLKLDSRGRPRKKPTEVTKIRMPVAQPTEPTDEKALAEIILSSNISKDTKLRLLGELL